MKVVFAMMMLSITIAKTSSRQSLLTFALFIIIMLSMHRKFARSFAMVMPGAASEMEGGRMALG